MPYIFSTATNSTTYNVYEKTGNNLNASKKRITINGGHGRINKSLITPQGVATQVTDEELAVLEANPTFKRHVERGYLRVSKAKADAEKVSSDMTQRDKSAQLVDGDFKDEKQKPKVNKES